ncbi:MAG: diguanylate cyclase [Planctomycetota bacterium]|nr:MAG: diguanylate cyclase [Planctomycetota bacterium]
MKDKPMKEKNNPLFREEDEPFAILEKLKNKVSPDSTPASSELKRENEGLKKLLQINKEINSELDLDRLLKKIMDTAIELTGAERGFLLMKEKDTFVIKVARNYEKEEITKPEFKISYSIAKEVAKTGEPILSLNAQEDTRFGQYESVRGLHLSSVLCVPFKIKKRILGVLYIDNRFKQGVFGEWEKYLLTTIAAQEAIALENARLYRESIRDSLTGLYAHNYFLHRLQEEVQRAELYPRTLSLLILDIDGFTLINEILGHSLGNEILQEVGAIIQKNLREIDLLARFSGDEFEILLPDTDKANALRVGKRILEAVRAHKFHKENKDIDITLSAGLSTYPNDAEDSQSLKIKADEALYQAQRRGKNQIYAFRQEDEHSATIQRKFIRNQGLESLALNREGLAILGTLEKLIEVELDLQQILELLISLIPEVTKAKRAFIAILRENNQLHIQSPKDHPPLEQNPLYPVIKSILTKSIQEKQPLLISDILQHPEYKNNPSLQNHSIKSIACVPIRHRKKIIGAIYLDTSHHHDSFTDKDILWLEELAKKISTPIRNSLLFQKHHIELEETKRSLQNSLQNLTDKYGYHNIIGKSEPMQKIYALLEKISHTSHPVLIQGESGTGKELIARAIHYNGSRKKKPFVAENCAAITDTLLEAELFGYVKGAFTGANQNKKGIFEIANGGTLFLDEVGDMSLGMQKKLLRVLQEGEIRPVGGKNVISVDVRIISASNKDLKEMVQRGEFREDLYYRLNVILLKLPPLRARREDIPLLAEYFLKKTAQEQNLPPKNLSPKALQLLLDYSWPGNIRELQNEIARAFVLAEGKNTITPDDFSEKLRKQHQIPLDFKPLREILESCEKQAIANVLEATNWNKSKTAKILDISRTTLDKKIQLYQLLKKEEPPCP